MERLLVKRTKLVFFPPHNEWRICKDNTLMCKFYSKVNSLASQTHQGPRLSNKWSGCLISIFGADQAQQLPFVHLKKRLETSIYLGKNSY